MARGFTFVELLGSLFVVSFLAVAASGAVLTVLETDTEATRRERIADLGLSLLDEIVSLPFEDPETGSPTIGPEAGEWSPPTTRASFDDVDDYSVWTGHPALQTKAGTPIAAPGYTRAVSVVFVTLANLGGTSAARTNMKRITVTVFEEGVAVGTYTAFRTAGGRHVDIRSS